MKDYFNTNKCFSQKRQPNSSWKNTQKLIKLANWLLGMKYKILAYTFWQQRQMLSWQIMTISRGILEWFFRAFMQIAHTMHPRFIDVSGLCSWIWIHYNHHTMQFLCVWDVKVRKVKSKKVERLNYFLIQYNHCTVRHGSLISCSS